MTIPDEEEKLIQQLSSLDSDERGDAAEGLIKAGTSRAVLPLIKCLTDEFIYPRNMATEALGTIGDRRAVEPLIAALNDSEYKVRGGAVWALGVLGDTRAVEPLIQHLKFEDDEVSRGLVIEALANLGDSRAIEPLIQSLHDTDPDVRWYVINAFKSFANPIALPALTELLLTETGETSWSTETPLKLREVAQEAILQIKLANNIDSK